MPAKKTKIKKFNRAMAIKEALARGEKIPQKPPVIIIEKGFTDARDGL